MIQECLDIFYEKYKENDQGDELILQNYNLAQGNYYFVDIKSGEVLESLLVDKDTEKTSVYRQFRNRDYLSTLLEMNKPIDTKKQIHSNNYLSFFVKKDKLEKADIVKVENSIDAYYDVFIDFSKKYDKKKMELLENLNIEDDANRSEEIDSIRAWILNNLEKLDKLKDFKADKNYLKLFFINGREALKEKTNENYEDMDKFRRESEKYFIPNLYNTNEHNTSIDDTVFGVPNNNFNLNSKKPYLMNKTKKYRVPYMTSADNALKQKLFFDWLFAVSGNGLNNIYIGKKFIGDSEISLLETLDSMETLKETTFKGYYIRIIKEKNEAEIVDFDLININKSHEESIKFTDYLRLDKKIRVDDYYDTLEKDIKASLQIINSALFAKKLTFSFFADPKNVSRDSAELKDALLRVRDVFINWYFKGKDITEYELIESVTFDMLLRHLSLNQFVSMANAYNVRKSLLKYIKTKMGDSMSEVKEMEVRANLLNLVRSDDEVVLVNERDFCFALGQLWYYLISKSEAQDKSYSMILPILQNKKIDRIKSLTMAMIEKYGHALKINSKKLNNLITLVMTFEGENNIKERDWIVAGFASKNVVYEKENTESTGKVDEVKNNG